MSETIEQRQRRLAVFASEPIDTRTEHQKAFDRIVTRTAQLRSERLAREAATEAAGPGQDRVSVKAIKNRKKGRKPRHKRTAEEMADHQLDRMKDTAASAREHATRKERLLKGPKDLRALKQRD
jgi:hypothetical protein